MNRPELVNEAALEAARIYVAHLLRYQSGRAPLWPVEEALQELRDALAAQSRVRVRR